MKFTTQNFWINILTASQTAWVQEVYWHTYESGIIGPAGANVSCSYQILLPMQLACTSLIHTGAGLQSLYSQYEDQPYWLQQDSLTSTWRAVPNRDIIKNLYNSCQEMMYGQACSFNGISLSIPVQDGNHSRPKHVGLSNRSRNHLFVPLQFLKRIFSWYNCSKPNLPQPLQLGQKRMSHQLQSKIMMSKVKKMHLHHHVPTPAIHQMRSVPLQQHLPLW